MANIEVVWRGPVKRALGIGTASREYVSALRRQGVNVKVDNNSFGYMKKGILKKRRVLIYHQLPRKLNIAQERKRFDRIILNTVWETTRIPRSWFPNINKFDAVCVPTKQNKTALQQSVRQGAYFYCSTWSPYQKV
ncbi:hypothetical protein [Paenibacillus tyrfis]|uniref:Glycosyltransferase subfamily 4-like N-terminal domain-containing protein n=1 Tax=Paenibacillus tyrfis TaxID=1501230 RepID=A0A081NXI1_9BACL|nr:hypothetical protein [Paenibacillus tyrfis]KEQ23154.1 hypothetical protein ET33_17440 [Paenibacillus tyrfis]